MPIINPWASEWLVSIFRHLQLKLLTQFPALNDENISINGKKTRPNLHDLIY